MSEEITVQDTKEIATVQPSAEPGEIVVIANRPEGVHKALGSLSGQMTKRIEHWTREKKTLEHNLVIAKRNKLKLTTLVSHIASAQKRIEFYAKLRDAFNAGYVPIPNMPGVDVFAIRTNRKKPIRDDRQGSTQYGGSPMAEDVETNAPPTGEGKNVDVRAFTQAYDWTKEDKLKDGSINKSAMRTIWNTDFDETIDFPFVLTKPEIIEATGDALARKIFDEFGVTPARPGRGQRMAHGDPMVIGRVVLRNGPKHNWRRVSFLIGWFIDTKDL